MIIDDPNGRLAEIKAFAKENNVLESFNNTSFFCLTCSRKEAGWSIQT